VWLDPMNLFLLYLGNFEKAGFTVPSTLQLVSVDYMQAFH
jgi:hypothetical protein